MDQKLQVYDLKIDGPLLRSQRLLLLELTDSARRGLPYVPDADDKERLEGVVALMDEIADQAHDRYGIDCLLEETPPPAMGMNSATCESWRVAGPTMLHDHDDDAVYSLIRADTDDPELQREIALVGAWDLEGERCARMIVAAPKLLAACRAVVERREHGDLAEAARMCAEAVQQATGASSGNERVSLISLPGRDWLLEQLLAKAEAAGLEATDLDETVHELAASIAADVNNEGLESQLGYLIDQLGGQEAMKQLDRLGEERSENTDCDVED